MCMYMYILGYTTLQEKIVKLLLERKADATIKSYQLECAIGMCILACVCFFVCVIYTVQYAYVKTLKMALPKNTMCQ